MKELTEKQKSFCRELTSAEKYSLIQALSALKKLAIHIGLIAPCKPLIPPKKEIRRRISKYPTLFMQSLLGITNENTPPIARAAFGILLECFIPGWRELADPHTVGMIVERDDKEVNAWKRAVSKRDGYKCVKCGSNENIEIHHIVRWVDAPQLRIMVENGITLCASCHKKEHFE